MAWFILLGLGLVLYKLADSATKSKPDKPVLSEIHLNFPENVDQVTACGDKLCLITVGHERGRRVIIINPATNRVQGIITLTENS